MNSPDRLIHYGLIFLIFFTPLAFGAVHIWAYTVMELTVFFLLLIWLIKTLVISHQSRAISHQSPTKPDSQPATRNPQPPTPNPTNSRNSKNSKNSKNSILLALTPLNLPLLFFLGLILFQLLPLPPAALKFLSPNTYRLYQETIPGWPEHQLNPQPATPNPQLAARNPQPWRPVSIYSHETRAALFKFLAYAGAFFLIINTVHTRAQIRRLVLSVILAGAFLALLGLLQMATGTNKIYWFWQSRYKSGGYFGPFVNPNHFAGYMEMVIPLTIGYLLTRRSQGGNHQGKSWRFRLSALDTWLAKNALLVLLIVIMVASLCFSLSRGGIITFLFSAILFLNLLLFTRYQRRRSVKVVLAVFSISLLFLIWLGIDPILKELSTLSSPQKASPGRPGVWKDAVRLAADYPVLGIGLGNFQHLYPRYKTIQTRSFYLHAENDYLEMLTDTGFLGVLLFFGGLVSVLITILKRWIERRDPYVRGITLGGTIGAAAILFHSLAEFNLHIPANALLLFMILGLTAATVHLKIRPAQEYSVLPARTFTLTLIRKLFLYPAAAVLLLALSFTTFKTCLASYHFQNYHQSLLATRTPHPAPRIQDGSLIQNPKSKIQNPDDSLLSALSLDPANASYHFALGQSYSQEMTESWKTSKWKLYRGRWYVDFKKETIESGYLTLASFVQAVHLQSTNGWYQLHLGSILYQLAELHTLLSPDSRPATLDARLSALDPRHFLNLALTLDPTNPSIKKQAAEWQGATAEK